MSQVLKSRSLIWLVVLIGVFTAGCEETKTTGTPTPTPEIQPSTTSSSTPKTGFEADLDYVRNGQYSYIWVFSRKDGKVLDKDDGAFLRKNAPQVVDWVSTDGGKRVIAGTNFDLEQGNLNLLKKRFVVENFTGR